MNIFPKIGNYDIISREQINFTLLDVSISNMKGVLHGI